ncbi:dihydropteroate synthase [Rothia kristinae]|uniref:Dihydropteroate synthase n=1 Tax=Rothia kristinae TaxID=37923 RepID=A0A1S2MZT1_9MICC|nr:dihydropteroate synthase [Rothia kristinae]OIJ35886.1 dihydropteroate synthase [Rothia kristinae]
MSLRWPSLPTGRTLVMGILNVTPDSFSDGGEHLDPEAAVAHGLALVRDGADLVDVGGESTRPGAEPVDPAQERRRILPVIRQLTERGVVVSVDTLHPDTAEAALQAGAGIVNDVSGARLREEMIELIARTGVPYILTHARGDSATMDSLARYADPVAEVRAELLGLRQRLLDGGVDPAQIVLDPGLGFAKGGDQDWRLLAGLDALTGLGHPVLVAASRKRFLGSTLAAARAEHRSGAAKVPGGAGSAQPQAPGPVERDVATAAVSVLAARAGAWAVRVHDVRATADALAVQRAWSRAGG